MFSRQYFSEQYFPAVWFAPADESHVPPDELRPEFRGGGGPDSSDSPHAYEVDDDEFLSPQLKQYVDRFNAERAAEWQESLSPTTNQAPLGDGKTESHEVEATAPSARLMALVDAKSTSRQDAQPNEEDEIAKILAIVMVLTDD